VNPEVLKAWHMIHHTSLASVVFRRPRHTLAGLHGTGLEAPMTAGLAGSYALFLAGKSQRPRAPLFQGPGGELKEPPSVLCHSMVLACFVFRRSGSSVAEAAGYMLVIMIMVSMGSIQQVFWVA
jgi:hypothetical protein